MTSSRRLVHNVESMNEKTRWCEAIGETPTHYLVLLMNQSIGVTSHVHAVLKSDYHVVEESLAKHKRVAEDDLL